jgi:hypothetical protein
MPVTKRSTLVAAGVWLSVAFGPSAVMAQAAVPSLDAPDLAQGPYAHMHMLFKKLFFEVADIDVQVDKPTQERLAALAKGQSYSRELDAQLANVAFGAQRAVVQMRYKRDIPFDRWVGVLRDNLELARKAGLITADVEQRIGREMPGRLAAIKDRGYEKSDRLFYSITPDSVQTTVVSKSGQVLVNLVEKDQGARRAVMGCYFAPKSDYRESLLRSLFGADR